MKPLSAPRLASLTCLWLALAGPPAPGAEAPSVLGRTSPVDYNPYWPGKGSPKLVTPQWVGESGVEAVVVLAIDDMSDPAKYEAFLRPILDRLKAIDGRAPVSIMTNRVDPDHPQLRTWLQEGLSLEVHTIGHPCPLLQKGDFAAAERSYHDCVDLMARIPGNRPVAFRMPCCDSMNSPSPRFYAELFGKASTAGRFLTIDSSVFNVFTPDDADLPRAAVLDADGRERFRRYLPFPSFVNTIENYPYPYVIGESCWEFPCVVPSDWEGQNIRKAKNPQTVEDMKIALDLTVLKKGVFNLVFHPHGWISDRQVVDLIDHAVSKHGEKVKFLSFREAQDRLDRNLMAGRPLRGPGGLPTGVRVVDLNGDGYMDVEREQGGAIRARIWDPRAGRWEEKELAAQVLVPPAGKQGSPLPPGARRLDDKGRDAGLRFVDLDEDGHLDVIFSNDERYGVYLYDPKDGAWTRKVMAGAAGEPGALPKIVRGGTNNGFWAHSRHLWWQNEDTAKLPDVVDRRSFNDLLKGVEPRGKSPEASRRSIRVTPGFRVELAACEPLVEDPIALDWGADGSLWVVEMGDYPLGLDGKGKPGGRVRRLIDRDGDGRYDAATTFLDGLPFPTGVMPWRDGVVVASAPDILFAADRDGDGKAEVREVLFTGFGLGNQQHRVNGFELGLDGWVYGANGDSGGEVRSTRTGKVVNLRGRDFRFRPDTGELEAESGQTQYGRHRDDWGNWFGNNNPNWGWQFLLSERDAARNPHHAAPNPRRDLEPDTRLYPISPTRARFNDPGAANRVTSANSPTPYRDDLFGPSFQRSLFVSEPVHNVVHRMVLVPDGPALRGVRAADEASREFLASSDNWFRPTQLRTGPDGALWIADMYRAVIEHPEWIPAETQARIDLRAGSREGRIYRVVPVDRPARPIPRLDRLDTAGLVAALDGPNGWRRDTAQRLLLHRADGAAVGPLRDLARSAARPEARVQALWTLACLGGLDESTALAALRSGHVETVCNALRACEPTFAAGTASRELRSEADGLAGHPDARVRFQLALTLGRREDSQAGAPLARIARGASDPWLRAAVFCSAVPHLPTLLVELFRADPSRVPPAEVVEPLVAMAGRLADPGTVGAVEEALATPAGRGGRFAAWQLRAARGWLEAAAKSKPLRPGGGRLAPLFEDARRTLRDPGADEAGRVAAIGLLGLRAAEDGGDRDLLLDGLGFRSGLGPQLSILEALARGGDPKVPEKLLGGWKSLSPEVRRAALGAMLDRPAWTGTLLSSLEDGCVPPAEVDPAHRQVLLAHRDPETKARALAVFEREARSRQEVVDAYLAAPSGRVDAVAGLAVFRRACATCHKLGDLGVEVGPDLRALADRSPQALLVAILDPNRAFESRYGAYSVATADGRVLSGMIAGETAVAVTLRRQEGKEDVILRSDIEEMTSTGRSLMPEGLEKEVSPKDMADLVALLTSIGPPPKSFAGNRPLPVAPADDGSLSLAADAAEIRGSTLVFEPQFGNLGYWSSADDRAAWRLEVPRAGRYEVWIEWACPDGAAGDTLEIAAGDARIRHVVEGTGTWDDYRRAKVGEIGLGQGGQLLEARAAAPPKNALLDLRRLELRPVAAGSKPSAGCSCRPGP